MNIDFNNVRRMAVKNYDSLAKKLNYANGDDGRGNAMITIDPEEIQTEMDDLRTMLLTIAATYDAEGDENFKNLYDELGEVATFNPQPEYEG